MRVAVLALVLLFLLGAGAWSAPEPVATTPRLKVPATFLPGLGPQYRVQPYMDAAFGLQRQGKEAAIRRLSVLAEGEPGPVIVLCRMLFTKNVEPEFSAFRRPALGAAFFLGDTDYADWPLEPIEVVNGVPFLITRGYALEGFSESGGSYLRYCVRSCAWSATQFGLKTAAEREVALEALLMSPKWKSRLGPTDRKFLRRQIE